MGLHAQQQILNAIQAALVGGTVAGSRVFVDRVDPLQPDELPAILIEEDADGETAQAETVHGLQLRELSVQVSAILTHSTTAAADARAFGLAVEKLISASAGLDALAKMGFAITSSRLDINGASDMLLASRLQQWRFAYLVNPTTPDLIS